MGIGLQGSFAGPVVLWDKLPAHTPFRFDHRLNDDPLMQLEAIARLADRMDPTMIEVADAKSDKVVKERITQRLPADRQSPGDVIRTAEQDRRWLSMRHVETDPLYGQLVRRVFEEFRTAAGTSAQQLYQPEGYIFIGASNATTPAHVDHEHNLFFHIRGTKAFTTGRFPDGDQEHRTFEGMYTDEYGATDFAPANQTVHDLEAGDGLYVPPTALHLVENSGSLAISFSLVFHDRALDQSAKVYLFNAHLRRLQLAPLPPGRSRGLDNAKAVVVDAWRRTGPLRGAGG